MYKTEEELNAAVRRTPLVKRLGMARKMIGKMVKEERRPKISVPPMPTDEDILIIQTLKDAADQLEFENLRDRFAMAALTGLVGVNLDAPMTEGWQLEDFARKSYQIADAMLKARNA